MVRSMIDLRLMSHLVVADSVKVTTLLEYSLHLAEELRFVVVAAYADVRPVFARQDSSRVAYIDEY